MQTACVIMSKEIVIDYNIQGDWLDNECKLCGFLGHHPCCRVITDEWQLMFDELNNNVVYLFGYPIRRDRIAIRLDKAKRLA